MKAGNSNIGNLFLITALIMLLAGLIFGLLAAFTYLSPDFLKTSVGFSALRPMHVSAVLFWIILGATGCLYHGMATYTTKNLSNRRAYLQWFFWIIAIAGIYFSYFRGEFGGREYWEFNPVWALPIVLAWLLFMSNAIEVVRTIKQWPVYVWMWLTGILFFLFTFLENYLWIFPYFRTHFVTDATIQWKVNGSLVGSWNQIIYGTAFFLMDRIQNTKTTGRSTLAFAMFFLGLTNLMFNWGHHIYVLPTEKYIRYIGYIVSMTEWVFFIKIIIDWRKQVALVQKYKHLFAYQFLIASECWVFLNLAQAILMSVPAINIYTHGTHVTVAHAMGTTIGINTMILLAACFEFLKFNPGKETAKMKWLTASFWVLQVSLLVFWVALNGAGIKKGMWMLSESQGSYSKMMLSLRPFFETFFVAGIGLFLSISVLVIMLLVSVLPQKKHFEAVIPI